MSRFCILFTALFLAAFLPDAARAVDAPQTTLSLQATKYRACASDSDCTTYETRCSAPFSVNKMSKAELDKWSYNEPVRCAVNKVNPTLVPACVSGMCSFEARTEARALERRDPRYCESAADCVPVKNACGQAAAFNRAHADKQQADSLAANPLGNCSWVENAPVMRTECRLNRCAVIMDNQARR